MAKAAKLEDFHFTLRIVIEHAWDMISFVKGKESRELEENCEKYEDRDMTLCYDPAKSKEKKRRRRIKDSSF